MSWRLALVLFALALVTRLPFQTENLWAHDSVLYERAMARFDPLDQRPQAPGYLYYVLLIRAVDALTGDANRAMTMVSLVADALAVMLLYLLAARLYDERTARISALFLLSAVTFWAYGGIAYPYTLLAALSIACALLFWRATLSRRARDLLAASALWGVAVGFRSDLGIFIAPLWLVAAWGTTLVAALAAALVVAALVGAWYLASAAADGGLARFAEALRVQGRFVDERYSIFGTYGLASLSANVYELARFLGRALYVLIPLAVAVPLSAAARHIELADRRRTLFVLLWALTPLVIYIPIHSGEYGYVFSMVPGLCVIAARGAIALVRGARVPRALPWLVASVVLANSGIFLVSDTPLSATDVARKDRGTTEKLAYLHSAPDLDRATLIAAYDALVVQRYTGPENYPRAQGVHNLVGYDPANPPFAFDYGKVECGPGLPASQVCAHSPVLAVWDDLIKVHGPGWETVTMPHGAKLRLVRNAVGARVRIEGLDVTLER